jgi:GntR family transcriptional regulator, rspAB operon transcriptional repressor
MPTKRFSRRSQAAATRDPDMTRSEEVYQKIRQCILKGEFLPAAPLSEYQLAAQFQLSRTPVREALTRLEHEGMVRTVTGHGTFVIELTPHDVMEIYQVREQLESFAARAAAERMDTDDLCKLEQIIARMNQGEAFFETDIDLHKTIVRATQNSRMFAILATLDDQIQRIRCLWARNPRWLDGTVAEHNLIVKCIVAHDPAGAEDAMRQHLRSSCQHAIRSLMPMLID